jgi:hypothetical protein
LRFHFRAGPAILSEHPQRRPTMEFGDDLLALIAGSLALACCLVAWAHRAAAPRKQLRKMMGMGALLGAAALLLVD